MNYVLWYWQYGCCQIKREWDRPADRGIDGSRGGMETRKRRMGEVDVWILCAFMCWGGWVYSKGRERCRKWLEIADALRGLQKINSSQEGKPQPPTCSPSPCLLMLPFSHLSPPPPFSAIFLNLWFLRNTVTFCALPIPSSSGVFVFASLGEDHVISKVSESGGKDPDHWCIKNVTSHCLYIHVITRAVVAQVKCLLFPWPVQ